MKWFKINYLKPGAEQMGKIMHLECTLFLHISPDSQCPPGSCCTGHKKLTSHWIWCLGLLCCPIPPLPLQSEEKLLLSLSVSLTVTTLFEKTIKEQDFSLEKASLGCA